MAESTAATTTTVRAEQIVSQFLLKSLHVILSARIPHLRPSPSPCPPLRNRDRWFNLALGETPLALDSLSSSHHRSPLDPLHLDLLLSPHDALLERWSISLDPSSVHSSSTATKTYKKSLLLLRSIYSLLRLLPAHSAFRLLLSPNHTCNFSLSYTLSSFPDDPPSDRLDTFHFSPVDTPLGLLSASVAYRPSLQAFGLLSTPLLPPRIIPNYVGSPAADPFRNLSPSLPRPHSWTSPPLSHFPLANSPDSSQVCRTFSASPTPSPPFYSGSPLRNRLLQENPGSSPVSIPSPSSRGTILRTSSASDSARSFLPPPSPRSARTESQESPSDGRSFRKIEGFRMGEFPSSLPTYALSKGVRDVKEESGRFGGILSSCNSPRIGVSRSSSRLSFTDDLDNGEFSCPFAVDDIDTPDSQSRNPDGKDGPETSQPYLSTRKSQDAEVGVLVRILKNAPPLRQDSSCSSQSPVSEYGGDACSSSLFLSRKTSDALEELRSYKEMKELLLSQSGSKFLEMANRRSE